jgi:hypothetical protein
MYALVALVPQQASDEGLGLVRVRGKTSRARSGLTRVFLCDPSPVITEDFFFHPPPFSDKHADALFYG